MKSLFCSAAGEPWGQNQSRRIRWNKRLIGACPTLGFEKVRLHAEHNPVARVASWPLIFLHVCLHAGELSHFTPTAAVLLDGTSIACTVAVFCSGYLPDYSLFDDVTRAGLDPRPDGLYLYRNMIPPEVRNLAFLTSNKAASPQEATEQEQLQQEQGSLGTHRNEYGNSSSSTSRSQSIPGGSASVTCALQSAWLAGVVTGRLPLPAVDVMRADVHRARRCASAMRTTIESMHAV